MKKKGFTLIELLAVIVILAIIALIAVPMVLNIIEKSKVGALKSSLTGLIESADVYYTNQILKGDITEETVFDFEDGEQISGEKLEYKGKIENGKLILHANGEVAACIDDGTHYAYRNKDDNEVTTVMGTCVYDGTTGDFSSNSSINDLRGKTLVATDITQSEDGLNTLIKIPEEGHYDETSSITVPIEAINSNLAKTLELVAYGAGRSVTSGSVTYLNDQYEVKEDTDIIMYFGNEGVNTAYSTATLVNETQSITGAETLLTTSGGVQKLLKLENCKKGDIISYTATNHYVHSTEMESRAIVIAIVSK